MKVSAKLELLDPPLRLLLLTASPADPQTVHHQIYTNNFYFCFHPRRYDASIFKHSLFKDNNNGKLRNNTLPGQGYATDTFIRGNILSGKSLRDSFMGFSLSGCVQWREREGIFTLNTGQFVDRAPLNHTTS